MNVDPFKLKVSLDSRTAKKGDYFVAVNGEVIDGHKFIDQAKRNGAVGVLEEDELYELASKKLKVINPRIIAITGSLGKSTTSKFIAELLSVRYNVAEGTLNTKLGLATNIINSMTEATEYFVAECGMDKSGELIKTGKFINPDVVVLTNVSESHMQFFKSQDEIIKGKGDLLKSVKREGSIYINWDSELAQKAEKYSNTKDIYKYSQKDVSLLPKGLKMLGEHNRTALACAYMLALEKGVEKSKLTKKIMKLTPPKGRLNVLRGINGSTIIDDSYNGSAPDSVLSSFSAADDLFEENNLKGKKIAVLGAMLELGNFEDEAHKSVGDEIVKMDYDYVILSGELARKYDINKVISNTKAIVSKISDHEEAVDYIKTKIKPTSEDLLLFKGSQGTRLEKIIEPLLIDPSKSPTLLPRQDARWK